MLTHGHQRHALKCLPPIGATLPRELILQEPQPVLQELLSAGSTALSRPTLTKVSGKD